MNNNNSNNNFEFNADNFDMDIFDLDRSKSILIAFEELFPLLTISLKTESTFYMELYPYVFSYYQTKKEYIDQKEQPLIASSKAFNDVKHNLIASYKEQESKLYEHNIFKLNSLVNVPLEVFDLNEDNNYIDTNDL